MKPSSSTALFFEPDLVAHFLIEIRKAGPHACRALVLRGSCPHAAAAPLELRSFSFEEPSNVSKVSETTLCTSFTSEALYTESAYRIMEMLRE